ncbi:hypothetical protein QCA50_018891 [Cerrena zonata]|uniref:FHA domain-containing protein n=1 Tax=Cerrena zonata TaxID=2478898 RepID=A0AAW0FAA4_9APHY
MSGAPSVYITDHWSSKGTLINGVVLPSNENHILEDGDIVTLGYGSEDGSIECKFTQYALGLIHQVVL